MSGSTTSLEDKTKQAFIRQLLAKYYRNNPKRKLPRDNNGFHSYVLFGGALFQSCKASAAMTFVPRQSGRDRIIVFLHHVIIKRVNR